MKENEDKLNSDFDLKVKHDITEKLRNEKPAELGPSPILSAEKVKTNTLPLIILAVVAVLSLCANVFLASSLVYKNAKVSQLESDIEKNKDTILKLRIRLNDSEE